MMKTILFLTSLTLLAPAWAASGTGPVGAAKKGLFKPDDFGQAVFRAIAKNDYPALRATSTLSFNAKMIQGLGEDMIQAIEVAIKEKKLPNPEIGKSIIQSIRKEFGAPEGIAKIFKDMQKEEPKFKQALTALQTRAKAAGIDWAQAKYQRTDASKAKEDEFIPFRSGLIVIHFQVGDQSHQIQLPDCGLTPRWGWKLSHDKTPRLVLAPQKK